ncbi:MAG: Asp-tRNA(Asn)/Glu-tRNA(Gln) amidotransferase subunit GatB [Bacteroidota bacterium]|nr:Asp-tRNA(Asn)/Glu-tRNA(Gln) amidotransferase subunit GatB [Bacteroidota bacterium]
MSELNIYDKYETVVGLEVHAQLLTKTKAYSNDDYEYGSKPNTQISVVSLAHPGALPKPNKEALKMAVMMGIACNSDIHQKSFFARKNYFYADLPKGYQITQFTSPIATGGFIKIKLADGGFKDIKLDKIIMEEDSGKSMHDLDPFNSLIDLNRAGVPLIEIVTDPDIREPEEAYQYLTEIRQLLRYLNICDGNMDEGSMRCDANISIRLKGESVLNTRVEVKNVNSIRNVARAIAYETKRQIELVEAGGKVTPDTRGYDAHKNETYGMRSKELANDYRYFPEPDIPPFVLQQKYIDGIKEQMPELPEKLLARLKEDYALSEYDAEVIVAEKEIAEYYLQLIKVTENYKAAANWINGPLRGYVNDRGLKFGDLSISYLQLAEIINEIDKGTISFAIANAKLLPAILEKGIDADVNTLLDQLNLRQVDDDSFLIELINKTLAKYPDKVEEYKNGKKGVLGLFMGDIMKESGGKADPKKTNVLLNGALNKA